jgi:hypothetical protein
MIMAADSTRLSASAHVRKKGDRMALRMGALYDALRLTNIPDETARGAAEEIAGLAEEIAGVDARVGRIEDRLTTLQWMIAVHIGITLMQFAAILALLTRLWQP